MTFDLLAFWEAVNDELAERSEPEVTFADIRTLSELFSDPVEAAIHEITVRHT